MHHTSNNITGVFGVICFANALREEGVNRGVKEDGVEDSCGE